MISPVAGVAIEPVVVLGIRIPLEGLLTSRIVELFGLAAEELLIDKTPAGLDVPMVGVSIAASAWYQKLPLK